MSNVSIDREKLKALLRAGNDLLLWSYSDNTSEESKEIRREAWRIAVSTLQPPGSPSLWDSPANEEPPAAQETTP